MNNVKWVIDPFKPNGCCEGCYFSAPMPVLCKRPPEMESCIRHSRGGVSFGMYIACDEAGEGENNETENV